MSDLNEEHSHTHHQCGCGHDHSHQNEHLHSSGHPQAGQNELFHIHVNHGDVCEKTLTRDPGDLTDTKSEKRVYLLENLGCANCASKMEQKILALPEIDYASISFTTKQLRVAANDPEKLLPVFQEICSSIEPDVKVVPRTKSPGIVKTKTFMLENLGCANCASKMEKRINELTGINNATITFATKQLKVSGLSPESMLPEIQKICSSIESDVKVVPKETTVHTAPETTGNKHKLSDNLKSGIFIGIGSAVFIAGEILKHVLPGSSMIVNILFVLAYIILGYKIVWTAINNLFKGRIFDENFLMSIATLGAFCIGEFAEAVGVMLFYRIGELFEHVAVEKSRGQIMSAVDMRPEVVNLLVGEDVRIIPSGDAQVDDILLVRPGDRIPLDGVVVEGDSRLDTSPLTGEPVPVKVASGDKVTSGCINTSGVIKIRVEKVLEESMVTRILDSVENAAASKPKIDRFITRFSRAYTPFVVILALFTAIVPSLITGDWTKWIYTALTFLVISCPCALVLSVPLAFFSGIGAGSKRGILFKGGAALEAIKDIKVVAMDKTGTITEGNFVVQNSVPTGNIEADYLLALAAGCERTSTHPIANSIVNAACTKGLSLERPTAVNEFSGRGVQATLSDGEVLCGNFDFLESFQIDLSDYKNEQYGTEVLVALNRRFIGHIIISDTIKEDAAAAISAIKGLDILTVMLTGDGKSSAEAVAAQTGIDDIRAKLLPHEKLTELRKIQDSYGQVMFVGDGINDAPVLAGADVGAAMGSGADAAIEAADVVFMTSAMEAIPQSISIARITNKIAVQNIVFALAIKALVMVLGLAGFANMWMAVFADTGVAIICVLNSIRILYRGNSSYTGPVRQHITPKISYSD